jgi:hypothetical protein
VGFPAACLLPRLLSSAGLMEAMGRYLAFQRSVSRPLNAAGAWVQGITRA